MQDYIRDRSETNIGAYDMFVGMDVDSKSISVSVNDGQSIVRSLTMPSPMKRGQQALVCMTQLPVPAMIVL